MRVYIQWQYLNNFEFFLQILLYLTNFVLIMKLFIVFGCCQWAELCLYLHKLKIWLLVCGDISKVSSSIFVHWSVLLELSISICSSGVWVSINQVSLWTVMIAYVDVSPYFCPSRCLNSWCFPYVLLSVDGSYLMCTRLFSGIGILQYMCICSK